MGRSGMAEQSDEYTIDEVCERLHITRSHWRQLVYRGEAPPRIAVSARKHLVSKKDLDAWIESRREVVAS